MKRHFTISLQSRLSLSYALFTGLALGGLTVIINLFTGLVFTALIKDNIAERTKEIVEAVENQYKPGSRSFDAVSIEAMGMYFVHGGYIVTVEDEKGGIVWDARSCDMQECTMVLNSIAERMEGRFGLDGSMRKDQFPLQYSGKTIGTVTVETYGPFFYSETESTFLTSINRLLLAATVVLILFSAGVSIALSRAIAQPVNKSAEAARKIARVHSGDIKAEQTVIRIEDNYKTRELAELARSINHLAAELEEGERRQRQLSSDVAHELRTPLACLQGNIEAMIDGVYKPDREHLESCHEEILRLTSLVQDLNILAGFEWETIALNKTEFDLARLLYSTAEQFRPQAHEKGIEINLDPGEPPGDKTFVITADYDRLKQVFINLLSNAVKYTDRGSITISIKEGEAASARWEVAVADTGIGIPEKDLPRVFERFYRSDKSRSRSTGGAGIGLAIAAAIIRAHGGTISAESGGGKNGAAGSVFRIRL
ncbi:MAG: ATP-binding protein [Treponema sp.]|jgi:signal transduction histidine kinase|nr:ATP-binding protein [Treponema sp.]